MGTYLHRTRLKAHTSAMLSLVTIAVSIVFIDIYTKGLANSGFLGSVAIKNPGLAFSIPAHPIAALLLTLSACAALFYFIYRFSADFTRLQTYGLGLIVGGSVANLFERALARSVTDFIRIGASYANIADIAIFLGIALLIVPAFKRVGG